MLALYPLARDMPPHFEGILDWLQHQLVKPYIPNLSAPAFFFKKNSFSRKKSFGKTDSLISCDPNPKMSGEAMKS
jgi:hypothetical protein